SSQICWPCWRTWSSGFIVLPGESCRVVRSIESAEYGEGRLCPESVRLCRCACERRLPAKYARHGRKILCRRRDDVERGIRDRMGERQPGAGQQQAMAAEQLLEQAVVAALAVGGVADDRVGDVL